MLFWAAASFIFSFNAAVLAYSMPVMISAVTPARILSSTFLAVALVCLLGATLFASFGLTG
jgi:hypothetical protein